MLGGRQSRQGPVLTQKLLVRRIIADKMPDQSIEDALRAVATQLIEQRFGIRLAIRTVRLYLSRWGFTTQNPMKKSCEQLNGSSWLLSS